MKYCLLGEKLGHSYSKEIHNFLGLEYDLCEVQPDKIGEFLNLDYDGFNVTIPYKKEIIKSLDFVSLEAQEIGAVNTVVRKNGRLFGYNTDLFGMEYALNRANITLCGKNVMILGSGGTSLTARALCNKHGAKSVTVVSRTGEVNYQNCYQSEGVEVIVNTTPVGMFPNEDKSPIEIEKFPKLESVFDCVYNPLRTELVLKAQELGLKNSGGLEMLVAQGLKAREIWTGESFSDGQFEKVYKFLLDGKQNTVLIGMPSSGKTTVAKLLSKKTGKEVFDTDEVIFSLEGKTPSQIIEDEGEAYFRFIESKAVSLVSKLKGVIIATGGGAVLRRENSKKLKKDGKLFYLDRSLDKLTDFDRPLSKNGAISRLFEERSPIYESVCDKKVSNDGEIEKTVEEILKG